MNSRHAADSLALDPNSGLLHEALRQATAALDAAEAVNLALPMAQAHLQVALCYLSLSEPEAAEHHLGRAQALACVAVALDLRVQVLCVRAECALALAQEQAKEDRGAGHAARERARDAAFEAAHLAARVSDPAWEVKVLLRLSDVLNRCGDHEDASALQARAFRRIAEGAEGKSIAAAS